jgi:hypothetical protein
LRPKTGRVATFLTIGSVASACALGFCANFWRLRRVLRGRRRKAFGRSKDRSAAAFGDFDVFIIKAQKSRRLALRRKKFETK